MYTNTSGSSRAGGIGATLSLSLLGILLVAAATMFSFNQLNPEIERDLTGRVGIALQGSTVRDYSVDAQDVTLSGTVASAQDSEAAVAAVSEVYGVSRVINKLTIAGSNTAADPRAIAEPEKTSAISTAAVINDADNGAEVKPIAVEPIKPLVRESDRAARTVPATLTVIIKDGRVNTQGILSDDNTIQRLNRALTGKFGPANVKNELSAFDGSVAPLWIDGVLSMIDQLDGIREPILKVTGRDLVLGGIVATDSIKQVKLSTATRLLGGELNLVDNLVVVPLNAQAPVEPVAAPTPETEPPKAPPSLDIRESNGQITISGSIASERQADALRSGMSELFGDFEDELNIDSDTAEANWIEDALSVASAISGVSDFGININAGQMLLTGEVAEREQSRDLSIAATEIAGSNLGVLNNFSINRAVDEGPEDLLAESLMQELEAFPTQNIVFNKNSFVLTQSAREVLDEVAAAILGYDNLVVEIAGHTDSSGDAVRNLSLSKQRAEAVRDYLVERNVPESRLRPIGYGETSPISDNDTDAGRAANRRIEFNL